MTTADTVGVRPSGKAVCSTSQSLFALLCAFLLCSCGYAFQGSGSILPPDVRKIYIPSVENLSTQSGVGAVFTEALRDRFERYGVITVVEDQQEADAVLRARITKITQGTRSVTSKTDQALQQDSRMTITAELRRVNGPVLWRTPALQVTRSFASTKDVVVTSSAAFAGGNLGAADLNRLDSREISRGQEQEVLSQLVEDAAKQIYDQAVAPDF